MATRRRRQKCGWISTGRFALRQPADQAVEAGGVVEVPVAADDRLDRRRVDLEPVACSPITPSGLVPASNRIWCRAVLGHGHQHREPVLGQKRVRGVAALHGRRPAAGPRPPGGGRWAGPWSGMNTSVTLSISVVTVTESTGSRSNTTPGSKSCSTGAGCVSGGRVVGAHGRPPSTTPGNRRRVARSGRRPGRGCSSRVRCRAA